MGVPQVTITRTELGATFSEFMLGAARSGFIGHLVLGARMSNIQAGDVPLLPIEQVLQSQSTVRAPGAGYSRGQFEWNKYSFVTNEYGWEEVVDDRLSRIYADLIEQEEISNQRAMDFVLREFETAAATTMFSTGTFTNAAAAAAWSVKGSATPIADVHARILAIENATGIRPNAVVLDRSLLREARRTDEVLDALKYSGMDDPKKITLGAFATLWDVDFVLVAGADNSAAINSMVPVKNTANIGQTASLSRIWDATKVGVGRIAVTRDPQEVCVGRTIMWSEENAGLGSDESLAVVTEEYRSDEVRGNVLRARMDYQQKLIYTNLWNIITGC